MKILQIAAEVSPAPTYGIGRTVEELSKALVGRGHEVHVLTAAKRATEDRDGVVVHGVGDEYPFRAYNETLQGVLKDLPACERLVELWESSGPFDVVATHDWSGACVAQMAKRIYGCPLVAMLHGTQVGRSGGKLIREEVFVADMERWLCQRADAVTVPHEVVRGELADHYGVDKQKVTILPDGAGASTFHADVDLEEFRDMFAEPGERLILFAGRLHPSKGPDLLLDIAARLRNAPVRCRFVVAGEGPFGPELQQRTQSLGLQEQVRFVGHVGPSVLSAFYRVAHLLLVPSRYEAGGIAVLEAMLHDLPVLASGLPVLADLAMIHRGLQMVPAGTVDAWGPALERALKTRIRRLTPGPLDTRIPHAFRWDAAAMTVERVLDSVAAQAGAR